ncbi:MAG: helix-turn-helix transcriptional regulator [Draconibacterium sp.]
MNIYNNIEQLSENYSFYNELHHSNLLGSSIHFYNFHTKKELKLEVDYSDSLYKIVLCINGYSETFKNKNHLYSFKQGKTLLYKANSNSYQSKLKDNTLFNVVHLHFSKHLTEEIKQLYSGLLSDEVIELPISPNNIELLKTIGNSDKTNSPLFGLLLEKILLEQLYSFFDTFFRFNNYHLKKNHQDLKKIEEAKFILDQSDEYVTTEQLAKNVGVNTFKIKKLFKEVYHKNIFEYQVDCKLDKAHQLLLDTNTPLKDIAMQCGYQSLGSFSNAFKRKFSTRPSYIRKY